MKRAIRFAPAYSFMHWLDRRLEPKEGLVVIGVRGLLDEIKPGLNPANHSSVASFEELLRAINETGMNTVLPSDITDGELTGRDVMITFQPGYANNLSAIPLLKKYNAKALFLLAPYYIHHELAFPCDFMDRISRSRRRKLIESTNVEEREKTIIRSRKDILPVDDSERPLNVAELEELASYDNIAIGIMPFLGLPGLSDPVELFDEINHAGDFVAAVTGFFPDAIAFPDGQTNDNLIEMLPLHDIHIGLTESPGYNPKEYLTQPENLLTLKRRFLPTFATGEPENLAECILANRFFAGDYPLIG